MSSQEIKPYDRQPTDTDKSWAAFCVYRDLGRERTLEKAQKKCNYKSCYNLFQWSSKHKWRERCRAFDDEESQRVSMALQNERVERRIQMEKDAWNRRNKLILKADYIARIPLTKKEVVKSEDGTTTNIYNPTDKWSLNDALKFYEYSDKLGIFATGGEIPRMTEIDAVRVLAQAGLLPAEILEAAEQGSDALRAKITEGFQNLKKPVSDN
jgi:hypothetical protein